MSKRFDEHTMLVFEKMNTDYDSMIRVNSLRASMPINSVRRRSKNYDKKTVIFSQNLVSFC